MSYIYIYSFTIRPSVSKISKYIGTFRFSPKQAGFPINKQSKISPEEYIRHYKNLIQASLVLNNDFNKIF